MSMVERFQVRLTELGLITMLKHFPWSMHYFFTCKKFLVQPQRSAGNYLINSDTFISFIILVNFCLIKIQFNFNILYLYNF